MKTLFFMLIGICLIPLFPAIYFASLLLLSLSPVDRWDGFRREWVLCWQAYKEIFLLS
jgi:hypothetical protein